MDDELKRAVQKITQLPTLPVIAQKILSTVDNDRTSIETLENIIENDPAISAKILSVANSVFFGFPSPASTLKNAILRIGFGNVKNIALGISLMTVLDGNKKKGSIAYQRVFNHSVAVGFIANLLSKKLSMDVSGEIVISGILHDIGFLVMSRYFPDKYGEILEACGGEKTLLEAEKEVFHFTHCDMGNWLAEKWELPGIIRDVTRYHHSPSLAKENHRHAALIHAADFITTQNILQVTSKDPNYPFDFGCLEVMGISARDFQEFDIQTKNGFLLNGLFRA